MRICLLLIAMLVACADDTNNSSNSGSGDNPPANGADPCEESFEVSKLAKTVHYGSKLAIDVKSAEEDEDIEVSLAITCGNHKVVDKNQKTTNGKATFADIAVSGDNFVGQCKASVTAKICSANLKEDRVFTVVKPPANTSLPPAKPLPPPPELTIGDVAVGQPIDIAVPADFSGRVKIQPQWPNPKECRGYFLVHNDGDRLIQVLTGGVTITASNNKLEGLVLIKKNNASRTCAGLTLTTTDDESYPLTIGAGNNRGFNGNLSRGRQKLTLNWSSGPSPVVIFFTTASEGNLWTKYTGEMSSPAVSTVDHGSSGNAALVKTSSGNWSYINQ